MIENTEGCHPRPPSDQPHCGAQTLINLHSAKWVTTTTSSAAVFGGVARHTGLGVATAAKDVLMQLQE